MLKNRKSWKATIQHLRSGRPTPKWRRWPTSCTALLFLFCGEMSMCGRDRGRVNSKNKFCRFLNFSLDFPFKIRYICERVRYLTCHEKRFISLLQGVRMLEGISSCSFIVAACRRGGHLVSHGCKGCTCRRVQGSSLYCDICHHVFIHWYQHSFIPWERDTFSLPTLWEAKHTYRTWSSACSSNS